MMQSTNDDGKDTVVIMTNIANGHVTNTKDLEAQKATEQSPPEEIETTTTTYDKEDSQPLKLNHKNLLRATSSNSPKQRKKLINNLFMGSGHARESVTAQPNTQHTFHIPPATKAPKETLKAVYAAGKYKAGLTLNVLCVQSIMAGIYIAAAGHLFLAVGGGVLGSALFPGGLIAVILTSAELFTGDALIFVASVLGKQVPFHRLVRNWSVSWCSNFVGSLGWAYFMAYLSDALVDSHAAEYAIAVAEKKALNNLGCIFLKAIGANFMVCVAVWQGTCAEEVAGKVLALWFPTAAFVMMGFEHCIANMFFIPVGMMLGADVSVGQMFAALAMATLGNAVGGGFFVGFIYWYVFDSMSSFTRFTARIRHNMRGYARGHGSQTAGGSHASSAAPSRSTSFKQRYHGRQSGHPQMQPRSSPPSEHSYVA